MYVRIADSAAFTTSGCRRILQGLALFQPGRIRYEDVLTGRKQYEPGADNACTPCHHYRHLPPAALLFLTERMCVCFLSDMKKVGESRANNRRVKMRSRDPNEHPDELCANSSRDSANLHRILFMFSSRLLAALLVPYPGHRVQNDVRYGVTKNTVWSQ